MAKTAEEILNAHFKRIIPENISMWQSAINAANEYGELRAAQEIEAYKDRLKYMVCVYLDSNDQSNIKESQILKIIDAVK